MAINACNNVLNSSLTQAKLLHLNELEIKDISSSLEKFLVAEPAKINREGLPKSLYEFLRGAYQKIAKDGNKWQRDIAEQLLALLPKINGLQFWKSNTSDIRRISDFCVSSFMNLGSDGSIFNILGVEGFEILAQIHQKLLSCFAEKTVKDLQIDDQRFVIVPSMDTSISLSPDEQVLMAFFKRKDVWFVSRFVNAQGKDIDPIAMTQVLPHFLSDSTAIPRKFVPLLGQNMCVEKDLSPVSEKRIFADIYFDPSDPRFVDVLKSTKKFNELPLKDFPPLVITIRFYTGLPEYDTLKPNCISFKAKYSLENNQMLEEISLVSPNKSILDQVKLKIDEIENLQQEAFYFIEDFIKEWSNDIINKNMDRITHTICFPKNKIEKTKSFLAVLLDLSKKPEQNRELIEFLYEDLDPTLTLEEFEKIASGEELRELSEGELELTPKLMSQILINDALKDCKAATIAPSESNNNVSSSSAVPSIKDEVMHKDKIAQVQAFAKYAKKEKKSSKKEKKLPVKEVSSTTAPTKQFKMTSDEKEKVKSVMQGNPMRSKDFNKFYAKLLKRKMEESKQTVKKGSHIKLHLEKTDGSSTGFTLVRKHGKKDNVGFIGSQKRSLKDLFD